MLQSNFAAVLTTDEWISAVTGGSAPVRSNLLVSAQADAATARA